MKKKKRWDFSSFSVIINTQKKFKGESYSCSQFQGIVSELLLDKKQVVHLQPQNNIPIKTGKMEWLYKNKSESKWSKYQLLHGHLHHLGLMMEFYQIHRTLVVSPLQLGFLQHVLPAS